MRRLHHLVAPFLIALVVWILLQRCSEPAADDGARPAADMTTATVETERSDTERAHVQAEAPATTAAGHTGDDDAADDAASPDASTLDVLVLDPEGLPFEGATVGVADATGVAEFRATTDSAGRAHPPDRDADEVRVGVHADGFAPWVSDAIPRDARAARIVAQLAPGGEIAGVVVAADGVTPVADVEVRAWHTSDDQVAGYLLWTLNERRARTDVSGAFRLRALAPGDVSLEARVQWEQPRAGRALATAATGTTGVRLALWRTITVRFVPYDAATGGALRTLRMRVVELTGDGPRQIYESAALRVPDDPPPPRPVPDRGVDVWGHRTRSFQVLAIGYAASEPVVVDASQGGLEQDVRVPLQPDGSTTARVRLRVAGRTGAVPDELWVFEVSPGRTGWSGRRLRPVSGWVEMEVMPGHVALTVGNAPDGTTRDTPWLATEIELEIAPGDVAERSVVLDAGGFVRVRADEGGDLRCPDRVLRDGAEIRATFLLGHDEERSCGTSPVLAPGRYVLEFRRDDGGSDTVPCVVDAFRTTDVTAPPR